MPLTRHPLIEDFVEALEQRGHRVTEPRRAVVQAIARRTDHFRAEDLCEELSQLGRATVYRNVELMVDLGFVCRVLLSDGSLHYQVSHPGHHHHLICTECGSSTDFAGCGIEDVLGEKAAALDFAAQGHWLEVYGRCGSCRHQATAN